MANKAIKNIEFINSGFIGILRSEGTHQVIQETTDRIYQNAVANYAAVSPDSVDAAAGFKVDVKEKPTRWTGFVIATDSYAAAAESEDKVLTRAIT